MISLGKAKKMLSESQEDYLKQIFLLNETSDGSSTQLLAERLGVAPPSVTAMIRKLGELDLVYHEPYRGISLTEAGTRIAVEVVRHHRLIETYLHEALGYGWDEVHEEAERLEHYISETFEKRIDRWLGFPTRDPHGDPIPNPSLALPDLESGLPLEDLSAGEAGMVSRVLNQDHDVLNLFLHLHIKITAQVVVLEKIPGQVRVLLVEPKEKFLLPSSLASQILVIRSQEVISK